MYGRFSIGKSITQRLNGNDINGKEHQESNLQQIRIAHFLSIFSRRSEIEMMERHIFLFFIFLARCTAVFIREYFQPEEEWLRDD